MSMSELQWVDLLLEDIPAPVTANTEADVLAWMAHEEPPAQWWGGYGTPSSSPAPAGTTPAEGYGQDMRIDPLNASVGSGPGGGISDSGLGSYPNLAVAAQYTAGMINQTNMAPIKAALEANDSGLAFGQALVSSPWAGSHYGGNAASFAESVSQGPAVTNAADIGNATPGAPVPLSGASTSPTGTIQTTGILGDLTNPTGTIEKAGAYIALIAAGVGLVVLGVWKMANPGTSLKEIPAQIKSDASTAAGAAALAA
jgi:hypothetical protein